MGVLEIIYRPVKIEKILSTLESYQNLGEVLSNLPERSGISAEEQVTVQDELFTNIEIDKFYSAKKVIFDVYIKLSSKHYVKILHAGDDFSKARIDKYKDKKVTHLYFMKTDRRKYVMFINQIASKIVKTPKIGGKGKVKVLGMVAENFLEDAYTIGLKPQVISQAKEICTNVYKIISSDKKLYELLRELHDFDPSLYTHSFLTTFFAGAIIKQFEWQTQNTIETTALACMFHDIGKLQFPREMLAKRPEELNEQELNFYKEHPTLGSEMVLACPRLNETVRQIILQHHEANDGTGFPLGIKGREVQTLSNIVCLANDFVHLMEEKKLKPTDALLAMIQNKEMVYRYKSEIIEGMMKIFADPAKIKRSYLLPMNSKVVVSKKVS
jgi:putative nucleotidyltransferase with HDIG domain